MKYVQFPFELFKKLLKMLYYVTGFNIFGQWPCDLAIINKFHCVTKSQLASTVAFQNLQLLQINWSYNILQLDEDFYIRGCWNGKDKQLIKIPLPHNYLFLKHQGLIVGNDCNFILTSNKSNNSWVGDLKLTKEIKIIVFNEQPVSEAKKVKQDCNISKVSLMNDSCLYLTSLGTVYCGILPSYVDTEHCKGKICDVQCGYEHFVLLTDEGFVYTWGNGRRLQLGHGDISNVENPVEVEALAGIKITKVSCGGWHTLALSEFGDLYAWGWNDTGQLGIKQNDDTRESYSVPTLVDLFDSNGIEMALNVIDIGCGSRHSAILLENNTVWTTGFNKYGQLGFSEIQFPSITYFKEAFKCDSSCRLLCGPWTTVLIVDDNLIKI